MAWARFTDTAATSDVVMAVVSDPTADERLVNETFGFVARLYLQAAQQQADYVVTLGVASLMGGARTTELIDVAERAGYLSRDTDDQGRLVLKLKDDPEFIHIRTAAELQWEKQRKADNGNVHLVLPVRLRDGDACRSCGRVVRFGTRDHRSKLAGTYDHRTPGQACQSPEDMVVLCKGCNSGRRDAEGRRDELFPLLAPPEKPYFHRSTVDWLREPEHRRVLEDNGLRAPAALPAKVRDRRGGTMLRRDEVEQLRKTGTAEAPGTAAAPSGADPRPTPAPTEGQDAASTREQPVPVSTPSSAHQRPAGPQDGTGTATWHSSQGTRPEHGQAPADHAGTPSEHDAPEQRPDGTTPASGAATWPTGQGPRPDALATPNGPAAGLRRANAGHSAPPLTWEDETCRSRQIARLQDLDSPGRVGTGRDGSGQHGDPRPQGASGSPGGPTRKRKRGRRGRRRK